MLILGVTSPAGEKRYVAAAFPSACGKTNFAMLIPPRGLRRLEGHDDRRRHRLDQAVARRLLPRDQSESGYFGVAPGTSYESNPNAMETLRANVIFTNVALTDDGDVWWEGMTKTPPAHLTDWQGESWTPEDGKQGRKAAHPNARFTVSATQCPSLDPEWDNPAGVPIAAFVFGARRSDTVPLVVEARSWEEGVYKAATMGSETTARRRRGGRSARDPFAMLPFCGYHVGDYFAHWLRWARASRIRRASSRQLVPQGRRRQVRVAGLRPEHARAAVDRRSLRRARAAHGNRARLHAAYGDLDWRGIDFDAARFDAVTRIDMSQWQRELASHDELFGKLGAKRPAALVAERDRLGERLKR
jgi:phosphoenolpyruvate carboxykinase (GTP)